MNALSWTRIGVTALIAVGATAAACGSNSNNSPPPGANSSASSASNTSMSSGTSISTGTGASTSSSAATTAGSSSSTSSTGPADSGATEAGEPGDGGEPGDAETEGGSLVACVNVTANVTTCAPESTPECDKGCGPDLPPDAGQPQLGTKACTCTPSDAGDAGGVYKCADCAYLSPEPACYQYAEGGPPACALDAGVVGDKLACTTPCVGGTTSGVCTLVTDAGSTQGCVCVPNAAGASIWTCQTLWPSQ
jgi:hypothetical protein